MTSGGLLWPDGGIRHSSTMRAIMQGIEWEETDIGRVI